MMDYWFDCTCYSCNETFRVEGEFVDGMIDLSTVECPNGCFSQSKEYYIDEFIVEVEQ